jgi:hypothetical protein
MSLAVTEEGGTLAFRSVRYFVAFGRLRFNLPRLLEPGAMEIVHTDEGQGAFLFTLRLRHRRFGELLSQTARFRDV